MRLCQDMSLLCWELFYQMPALLASTFEFLVHGVRCWIITNLLGSCPLDAVDRGHWAAENRCHWTGSTELRRGKRRW